MVASEKHNFKKIRAGHNKAEYMARNDMNYEDIQVFKVAEP